MPASSKIPPAIVIRDDALVDDDNELETPKTAEEELTT